MLGLEKHMIDLSPFLKVTIKVVKNNVTCHFYIKHDVNVMNSRFIWSIMTLTKPSHNLKKYYLKKVICNF
jgi:hypothetical protein